MAVPVPKLPERWTALDAAISERVGDLIEEDSKLILLLLDSGAACRDRHHCGLHTRQRL